MTATSLLARFSEINLLHAAGGREPVVAPIRVALVRAEGAEVVPRPAEPVPVRELEQRFRRGRWWFAHRSFRRVELGRLRDQDRLGVRHLLLGQ